MISCLCYVNAVITSPLATTRASERQACNVELPRFAVACTCGLRVFAANIKSVESAHISEGIKLTDTYHGACR